LGKINYEKCNLKFFKLKTYVIAQPLGGNFVTYVFNNGCVIGDKLLKAACPLLFDISMLSFFIDRNKIKI
jgi:hypothetical protein